VEQEKLSTSNLNIYVLWQCTYFVVSGNNCILHVVRHTYYIRVKNSQVNESLSTFFMTIRFSPLIFINTRIYYFLMPTLHVMTRL
jgi:hypothetical protein